MANRSVVVRLKAEIADYLSNMRKAGDAAKETARQSEQAGEKSAKGFARLSKVAEENRESWDKVSTGLVRAGTVGVAGLGAVTKAAMDWESSWAGVTKTVEGTPTQLSAVEEGLRGLARELPASHQEIAAVAEAAGQLGIKTPDIVAFTRTMINLGETTNLSAEEAATSLARFMNIMGTSQGDVSKLGSALVGLGNNFATTEAEIMAMSMRLAGTGNQIGLSEGEVMGLAAAMSSVGIEAEAGGTAMSMTMTRINKAVMAGGKDLEGFAGIAGTSAEDFASAWREDPAAALDMFTQGVGRASAAGEDINTMLSDLGVKGVREVDTLLRLGGAADLLGEAFEQGNAEIEKNSALAAEAAKRYETTESQVRIAWNGIKDAAIDAGAVMLPVVQTIAESVAGMAQGFAKLPAPVQGMVTGLGGLAAVAALTAGAGMKIVTMAGDASTALSDLGISSDKTRGAMKGFAKAAGIAVVALAGFQILKSINNNLQPTATGLEGIAAAMTTVGDSTEIVNKRFADAEWANGNNDSRFAGTIEGINGIGDTVARLQNLNWNEGISKWGNDLLGMSDKWAAAEDDLRSVGDTLATVASSGDFEGAAEGFRNVAADIEQSGGNVRDALPYFSEYENAVRAMGEQHGYAWQEGELFNAMLGNLPPALVEAMGGAEAAAGEMGNLGGEMEGVAGAADETEQTLSDLFDLLKMMGMVTLDAQTATGAFHQALRDTAEATKDMAGAVRTANGEFDVTTEAGYAAQQAFADVAVAGWDMAEANAAAGSSFSEVAGNMKTTYDGLVTTAQQFGFTGEQAHALAREAMGVPDNVDIESWMSDAALQVAEKTGTMARDIPEHEAITTWMGDDAFREAVKTRAAALGIPEHEAISSFMDSYARGEADKTTAQVLGIPEGANVHSWMSENARNEAWRTKAQIDAIPKSVSVSITTHKRNIETWESTNLGKSGSMNVGGGMLKRANGGRIPALADGGRLPATGLGTDKILGLSSGGVPTAWVDDREWVVNRRSSDKYNALLSAVNRDDPAVRHLAGYANGGRVREYATGGQVQGAQGPLTATMDVAPLVDAVRSGMSGATVQASVSIGTREAKQITALAGTKR